MNRAMRPLDELLPCLQRLDRLLEQAVMVAGAVYGSNNDDAFRGLHIGQAEVERLLKRESMTFRLRELEDHEDASELYRQSSRLSWLERAFGLSEFEVDVLLIALAPDLDLKYERLYAYLQDDVTRKRPTVDLVLNLLCPSVEDKLAQRSHFMANAPLIRNELIWLLPDPHHPQSPHIGHALILDDQIVRFLLGLSGLDARIAPFARLLAPAISLDELPLPAEMKRALPAMVGGAWETRRTLRLYFQGPPSARQRQAAHALASQVGASLLAVDLRRAMKAELDFDRVLKLVLREAWLQDAVLFLDDLDALREGERAIQQHCLLDALAEGAGVMILSGTLPWVPPERAALGVIPVPFGIPDNAQRHMCWRASLLEAGIAFEADGLDALAERFRLTSNQIADAIATAHNWARLRAAAKPLSDAIDAPTDRVTASDLFAAARAQSGHDLVALARKVEPAYSWDDIVLPEDALTQLRELCQRVIHRGRVLNEWGFGRKLSLGKGVNALFAGPSGTGKTMAAEVIATELGLDLYKIDLAGVVSKYIGETEKNLDRIFTAAENANAILFFDEADALFGKRSEVHDSHDRYANIEISYLLQKMEQYEGIAILATNLRQNLDESFVRRMAFTVHFPFPDEADRRRIWERVWPVTTPVAGDVDVGFLAQQFKLSGGNIKNVALASAFLAAADGGAVTMAHLFHATQREYQKLGKVLSAAELYGALRNEVH